MDLTPDNCHMESRKTIIIRGAIRKEHTWDLVLKGVTVNPRHELKCCLQKKLKMEYFWFSFFGPLPLRCGWVGSNIFQAIAWNLALFFAESII